MKNILEVNCAEDTPFGPYFTHIERIFQVNQSDSLTPDSFIPDSFVPDSFVPDSLISCESY